MKSLEKDLAKFLSEYSNGGIELTDNLIDFSGVLADAAYDVNTKMFAYKLLGPIEAMEQDRTHIFSVKAHVYDKPKKRLSIHSEGDVLYIFRPCQTDQGSFIASTFQLSAENKKLLHYSLVNSVST